MNEQRKDVNMQLVGLGNTRILTDYAQKSPRTPDPLHVKVKRLLERDAQADALLDRNHCDH